MAKQAAAGSGMALGDIPDKLYFRIGEVAQLCGVETYVLRFWQTEFPQLAPKKSGTGQRLYRRRDVEQALRIKRLLHEEGYTIAGARQVFAAEAQEQRKGPKGREPQPELPLTSFAESAEARGVREQAERAADRAQVRLARMRLELRELHCLLSEPPVRGGKVGNDSKVGENSKDSKDSKPGLGHVLGGASGDASLGTSQGATIKASEGGSSEVTGDGSGSVAGDARRGEASLFEP